MNIVQQSLFVERFRKPNPPYLSPVKGGDFFGLRVQELAERARMHRNTPTTRPHTPQLQKYLQEMLRVLTVATEITDDAERAAFLLRNEPLRAFGYKAADTLVQESRADAVIVYLESLASGSVG